MKAINTKRVSLKTIAEHAGLSVSAVSQILNDKPNDFSSKHTKHKVREIANSLGYHPNFGYKLMRGEKTKTVALLTNSGWHKSEEYTKDLIISLISQFDRQGYACYLADLTASAKANNTTVLDLASRGVHYFIFIGAPEGRDQIKELLESRNKNYFVFGTSKFLDRYVVSDSESGVVSIIKFFLAQGRSNFRLFINPPVEWHPEISARISGLMKVFPGIDAEILEKRYVVRLDKVDFADSNPLDLIAKTGYDATARLLGKASGIQALFYLTDAHAIGGAKLLIERGITIGRDILLAGFNDTFAVRNYPYPISSVQPDIKKIAGIIIEESLKGNHPFSASVPSITHIREN